MKKALVHTHFNIPNYGANLQALATSHILLNSGYEPTYLDFRSKNLEDIYSQSVSFQQSKLHYNFVKQNLNTTQRIASYDEYKSFIKSDFFDLFVTGSDAVFKLQHDSRIAEHTFPNPFWLLEERTQKKLSIAPSAMGTNLRRNLTSDQRNTLLENFNSYEFLSVRDTWTMDQLKSIGVTASLSRDPVTFLHLLDPRFRGAAQSTNTVVGAFPQYFDQTWVHRLEMELQKHGLKLVDIGTPENTKVELDPVEWYNLISHSSGYIGVRFHPLIIATTHGVPVFSLDQYARTPLHRNMSKSYLHLRQQGLQKYHATKLEYRILTPKKVVSRIISQRQDTSALLKKYDDELKNLISNISNSIKEKLF